MELTKGIVFVFSLFTRKQNIHSVLLIILALVSAGLDLIGLTAIIPVFAIIFEPESLSEFPEIHLFLVDIGVSSRKSLILFSIISVSFLFLLKNIVSLVLTFLQQKFNYAVSVSLSSALLDSYYEKGLDFFKTTNSYLILRNLTSIPMEYSQQLVQSVMNIFSEGIIVVFIGISIFIVNPSVLIIAVIAFLPAYFVFYLFSKRYMAFVNSRRSEVYVSVNNYISQLIHGYEEVVLAGAKYFFKNSYLKNFYKVGRYSAFQQVFIMAPNKLMEFLAVLSLFSISIYLIYIETETKELLMTLSFFAAAAYRLIPSSNKLINALSALKSFQYVFDVYKKELDVKFLSGNDSGFIRNPQKLIKESSTIRIENISYSYPGSEVDALKNINLTINSGEIIGLMGNSGGGKTTLVNLLLGFYKPIHGDIYVDDKSIYNENMQAWHNSVGYVRQDAYIFNTTIIENIALGIKFDKIDLERVKSSLKLANLYDYCDSLKEGIYTQIEENGANLSGGQRQRIAIARALYDDCSLLVFDEATSALDNSTQEQITQEVSNLKQTGKTIIVVAHRNEALKFCSRIFKLEEGKIKDELSYSDFS